MTLVRPHVILEAAASDGVIPQGQAYHRGLPMQILFVLVVMAGIGSAASTLLADDGPLDPLYLFPGGAQRGVEQTVRSKTKLPRWPIQVWCASPGVTWQPNDEPGTWTVHVDPAAPIGLHWVRLHDASGASSLLPFLVDDVRQALVAEPNDSLTDAQQGDLPVVWDGQLEKTDDVDTLRVTLEKDQQLVACLVAHRYLRSPLDGVLQVVTASGSVLQQVDDERGYDPLLVWRVPETGEYFIRVFGFPTDPNSSINFVGGDPYRYRLYLTTGPFLDSTAPMVRMVGVDQGVVPLGWNLPESPIALIASCAVVPDQANAGLEHAVGFARVPQVPARVVAEASQPAPVTLPAFVTGVIGVADEVDEVTLKGRAGEVIELEVWADRLGGALDARLTIEQVMPAENQEAEPWSQTADDSQQKDAELSVTLPADGEFRASVRDVFGHGGPRFFYGLHLRHALPDYRLSVDRDHWTLASTGELEIEVTVTRKAFTESILVSCEGLPRDVVAEPQWSSMGDDSEKKVTLKVRRESNPVGWSGPFRIAGRAEGGRQNDARWPLPASQEASPALWLTAQAAPMP